MTYPLSTEVTAGQPTAASHYNNLRSDSLHFGQAATDSVTLGTFLNRFAANISLQLLATNRLRVPFNTTRPPVILINGCMLQAAASVDLAAGMFSGGAATWYVFAVRTAGSTTFTLAVNTSATEAPDQRIIGECQWDGSALTSVRDYFSTPLSAPDYDSGWFAAAYNTTYTKNHGLAQVPSFVLLEHATSASGAGEIVPVMVANDATYIKSIYGYDGTSVYVQTMNNSTYGVVASSRRVSGGGYLRIKAWR